MSSKNRLLDEVFYNHDIKILIICSLCVMINLNFDSSLAAQNTEDNKEQGCDFVIANYCKALDFFAYNPTMNEFSDIRTKIYNNFNKYTKDSPEIVSFIYVYSDVDTFDNRKITQSNRNRISIKDYLDLIWVLNVQGTRIEKVDYVIVDTLYIVADSASLVVWKTMEINKDSRYFRHQLLENIKLNYNDEYGQWEISNISYYGVVDTSLMKKSDNLIKKDTVVITNTDTIVNTIVEYRKKRNYNLWTGLSAQYTSHIQSYSAKIYSKCLGGSFDFFSIINNSDSSFYIPVSSDDVDGTYEYVSKNSLGFIPSISWIFPHVMYGENMMITLGIGLLIDDRFEVINSGRRYNDSEKSMILKFSIQTPSWKISVFRLGMSLDGICIPEKNTLIDVMPFLQYILDYRMSLKLDMGYRMDVFSNDYQGFVIGLQMMIKL